MGVGAAAAYTALLGYNLYAKSMVDRQRSFNSLEQVITLDKLEWTDYSLSSMQRNCRGRTPMPFCFIWHSTILSRETIPRFPPCDYAVAFNPIKYY